MPSRVSVTLRLMASTRMGIAELVDTERYPLDRLNEPDGEDFVAECLVRLEAESSLTLPGFLRPSAIDSILEEIAGASMVRDERHRTAYSWCYNLDFPDEHPRRALFRAAQNLVLTDAFANEGIAQTLFSSPELTEFVRRLLGTATNYPSACPTLSLMASVLNEGDEFGWHFDTNDGVVSILLQAADVGGHFEFAPYVRSETDESYDNVDAVFTGEAEPERLNLQPGTFAFFLGRRSAHRVSPVGVSSKPRKILLLSYDEQPGMTFTEGLQNSVRHPDGVDFLGQPAPI